MSDELQVGPPRPYLALPSRARHNGAVVMVMVDGLVWAIMTGRDRPLQTPDEADEYALSRVAEIASAKYANPLSAEQDVVWVTMDDLDGDERSYR